MRWTAKRIADSLELDGWVRNNPDGSVTMAIEGEAKLLDDMVERLDQAFGANIAEMQSRDVKPGSCRGGFDIVR